MDVGEASFGVGQLVSYDDVACGDLPVGVVVGVHVAVEGHVVIVVVTVVVVDVTILWVMFKYKIRISVARNRREPSYVVLLSLGITDSDV